MIEKMGKNIIAYVQENSIAEKLGIEKGDQLVSINEQHVQDIIEYMYLTADEYIKVEIVKKDGNRKTYQFHKEFHEDIGIYFENPIIDEAKSCKNKCIFCFIDQLPPNMRHTLYFKDDDSRLSFLQGNFITLTNMSDEDIQKIIRYRISPINISIHTTNPELRQKMLNNKDAGYIYDRLKRLADAGIKINGQIVLCPGVNDGEELDRTIRDLSTLYPNMESLAVVPVGLTNYRDKLYQLKGVNQEIARVVIEQIDGWQKKLLRTIESRFVFLSDEFYILGKQSLPHYDEYEGFPQLENGVGLMAKFKDEFDHYLESIKGIKIDPKLVSVVTGTSAQSFIKGLCKELEGKLQGLTIHVYGIQNNFFGQSVTVSGLVTGGDILYQLGGQSLGSRLVIPESMLKAEETVFLDDVSIKELEEKLKVPVRVSKVSGKDFIYAIIN